jgi:O-antigen/teichoic acid export membrane protein
LSDIKQLGKETAVYGISTILSRFLNFLLVPFYTNVFTQAEYGIVTNVFAYIALLNIIYLYGMDSAYLRYAASKDGTDEKITFSTSYNSIFLTSLFFSLFFLIFIQPISEIFTLENGQSSIVYYTMGVLFFDSIALVPFARLRLQNKAFKFAFIKSINIIVNLILNVVLILKFKMGIEAVFLSAFAASVLTWIILIPDIFKNLYLGSDRNLLLKLLKFGIPFVPAGLASMVTRVIDRPVMLALTDASTVGVYQANYKLGIFMMLFVSMFQYAWQPFFLKNAYRDDAKILFGKVLTYFTLAASFIFIVLSLFVEDLVRITIFGKYIIGKDFWGGLYVVPIILMAYLFNGLYVNFLAGIQIEKKTKYMPVVTGLGAVINVTANLILIPYWGMLGAAYATLLSFFTMTIATYFISQRYYRIEYEFNKIILIAIALILAYGGNLIFQELLHIKSLLVKFFIVGIFIFLIYLFGLVDIKNLKRLFS